jgi:hypothetical protein
MDFQSPITDDFYNFFPLTSNASLTSVSLAKKYIGKPIRPKLVFRDSPSQWLPICC